jgi:glycosyltransferase involved in cell wall biosynthesis
MAQRPVAVYVEGAYCFPVEAFCQAMKVSVVVPVYNKSPFLEECFNSLFTQTYSDFELIAVDDASTDDGLMKLRSMRDPRLRIIALEHNVGPGLAAQRGIDEAKGEFILRADADDIQLPDRIATQVDHLESHPDLGAVSAQMALWNRPDEVYRLPLDHEALRVELLFGVALFQPVMALRRSALEMGVRYRAEWPRFGEDWMYQLELARVTRMANLDRPLVKYRIGPQNSSFGRDRQADLSLLFRHAFAFMGFPLSDEDLISQLYTARFFQHRPPDASALRAYRDWLVRIRLHNSKASILDPYILDDRLRRAWDMLLHRMPEFGWPVVWAYLRLCHTVTPCDLYYLLATLLTQGGRTNTIRV